MSRTQNGAAPASRRSLPRTLFGIAPEEATFERRGFETSDPAASERFESIGRTFIRGYHAALEHDTGHGLADRLHDVEPELQGFAFEGAAMGLALLDHLTPWRRDRWRGFVAGPAAPHIYMAHVGAGWALARLPFGIEPTLARMDPVLRWLAPEGMGFHEGYFHVGRALERGAPPRLKGYARRAFDQGLGRSLWFVAGADVDLLANTIAGCAPSRHGDLWSGAGLAAAYAGAAERAALELLRAAAGPFLPQAAQGASFAAKARLRAGNPAPHTELACEVLCMLDARAAADLTDVALQDLPPDGEVPGFEVWRRRLHERFAPGADASDADGVDAPRAAAGGHRGR